MKLATIAEPQLILCKDNANRAQKYHIPTKSHGQDACRPSGKTRPYSPHNLTERHENAHRTGCRAGTDGCSDDPANDTIHAGCNPEKGSPTPLQSLLTRQSPASVQFQDLNYINKVLNYINKDLNYIIQVLKLNPGCGWRSLPPAATRREGEPERQVHKKVHREQGYKTSPPVGIYYSD